MCIAIPGKVISCHGRKASVDFSGSMVEADAGLVDVKEGDRVLVHAGCIIQKLIDKDADFMEEFVSFVKEMEG